MTVFLQTKEKNSEKKSDDLTTSVPVIPVPELIKGTGFLFSDNAGELNTQLHFRNFAHQGLKYGYKE